MKIQGRLILMLLAFMMSITAFAQEKNLSGTIVDVQGEPIIGATVVQKGTSNGVISDIDGNFTITVEPGTTLVISYIGYTNQEASARDNMRIVLKEDAAILDDVVVVGYGVQKKSVVTASIAKVSADDLDGKGIVRVDNALKGLAAGVNVTSGSGAPGSGSRVRIRGVGTITAGAAEPLYIVDGMPLEDGIDYLNPSDIESIEVLKDAASGAVYGARAANGVILVTTKKGKAGKVNVNYNFSQGWQSKWRKRAVMNGTEYAIIRNEERVNAGMDPLFADPYSVSNTDWQDEIFNDNAPVQNHELSISGATDRVNYYLSLGYFSQDGIVGGNYDRSNYRRLTMRSNTNYTIFDDTKERSWLNKLNITSNISYSRIKRKGDVGENDWSNGVLGSVLGVAPTTTVTVPEDQTEATLADYISKYGDKGYTPHYDANGHLYTVLGSEYDNQFNPVAWMNRPQYDAWAWTHKFVANFAADLNIGYGFKWRTSYGVDIQFDGNEGGYTLEYYVNPGASATKSSTSQSSNRSTVWQLENLLTWDGLFDKHTVNVVLGQSAKKSNGWYLGGSRNYLKSDEKPYIDYTDGVEKGDLSIYGGPNEIATLASLFARASYNYDERYMAQFTVRRDGSSRFGSNNHYATFPSFSLGWNVTNEEFMKPVKDIMNNMKVRFSWGKNGNEAIGNFRYAVYTAPGMNLPFGRGGDTQTTTQSGGLANPDLKWEESVQTDFGVDFGFFQNALTFTVDYYVKKTTGMLMDVPIPSYVGNVKPVGNVGEMKNSGVEFELGYKWHIADAKFGVKANAAYLKNKLINLGNETGVKEYDSRYDLGAITRGENGQPFPYFYGYKTDGILQNQAEADEYNSKYGTNLMPGDFRFKDLGGGENGGPDGKIDSNDKTKIGKGTPDWTFGLNFNAEWRGFDFNMFWQGTQGNDIYDATLRIDRAISNKPSYLLNRWTGEGTSNSVPRLVEGNQWNFQSSDFYINDGSYLRLKNISLGYTIPQRYTKMAFVNRLRFFVMAENLITWTKYHGYDPEMIPSGGTSLSIDYGAYPQARTWTIGFNLGF